VTRVVGFAIVAVGVSIMFLPVSAQYGVFNVDCGSAWQAMFTDANGNNLEDFVCGRAAFPRIWIAGGVAAVGVGVAFWGASRGRGGQGVRQAGPSECFECAVVSCRSDAGNYDTVITGGGLTEPQYPSGRTGGQPLAAGECLLGWITYVLPTNAVIVMAKYSTSDDNGKPEPVGRWKLG
jgi:hypothetical protein